MLQYATQTRLEAAITIFIMIGALFVGSAVAIEMETGKPAKVAISEWIHAPSH